MTTKQKAQDAKVQVLKGQQGALQCDGHGPPRSSILAQLKRKILSLHISKRLLEITTRMMTTMF